MATGTVRALRVDDARIQGMLGKRSTESAQLVPCRLVRGGEDIGGVAATLLLGLQLRVVLLQERPDLVREPEELGPLFLI
jgi:hypothetical protein